MADHYIAAIGSTDNAEATGDGTVIALLKRLRTLLGGSSSSAGLAIKAADSPSIDAFARWRVSEPAGLFDSQLQYDEADLFWDEYITGSTAAVTHLPNESSARLRITGNEQIFRQTRAYHRYQPGKSQFILQTFVFPTIETGVVRRVGYFDGENGIFLDVSGTDLRLIRRTNASGTAVDNVITQANWNLDTFDGNGDSGITLDITKTQILIIDLEWLGVGRVRAGFVIDGVPVYAHEFLNANNLTTVYMTTPNLPLRYEIEADPGLTGTYDLHQICCQVSSEGGFEEERGIPFAVDTSITGTIAVTTRQAVLSIRPKATFNGLVNRAQITPESYGVLAETNSALVEIIYNGTLPTGTAWTGADSESIVEYAVDAGVITGGIKVFSEYIPSSGANPNSRIGEGESALLSKLPLTLDINGENPINLSIVVTSLNATSNINASFRWREIK